MDGNRFDALTRRLARPGSRRSVLRGLAGGVAALGLGATVHRSASAVICRQNGVLCAKGAHCCTGYCDAATKRCACPPGQTLCGDTCVTLDTDLANCGTCGNVCPDHDNAATTCSGGSCDFVCTQGFKRCGDSCIPASVCCTDNECGGGMTCQNGTCACPSGKLSCGGSCKECCVENATFGGCSGGQVCENGTCVDFVCPSGSSLCAEGSPSYLTCCGPQVTCSNTAGQSVCCNQAWGVCHSCGNHEFVCCGPTQDGCTCCSEGQTCNTATGTCSG